VGAAAEVFDDSLNGPLAHAKLLADLPARESFRLELQDVASFFRKERAEPAELLASLGNLTRSVQIGGDISGALSLGPDWLLAVHIVLLAGGAAIFVNYFILRSPSQKGDKMPRILEIMRARAHSLEEAAPHALEKIERVKPRPQEARKLAADDQAHLSFVTGQQLARGVLVTFLDPG
jgi:hypothetical protein